MCRPQLMLPNDDTTVSISATTVNIDNTTVSTGAISNEFRLTLCCDVTGFGEVYFCCKACVLKCWFMRHGRLHSLVCVLCDICNGIALFSSSAYCSFTALHSGTGCPPSPPTHKQLSGLTAASRQLLVLSVVMDALAPLLPPTSSISLLTATHLVWLACSFVLAPYTTPVSLGQSVYAYVIYVLLAVNVALCTQPCVQCDCIR